MSEEIKGELKTETMPKQNDTKLTKDEIKLIKNIESGKIDFDENIEVGEPNINPKYKCYDLLNYTVDPKYGLIINSKENVLIIRKTLKFLFKKIGSSIFKGSGLFNISLPLFSFDKMSMLERFALRYTSICNYFNKMATVEDPLEKMKYLITGFVSSFHTGIKVLKPFNPILGETFQAKIDDADIYVEQVSHHPPISDVLIMNKNFSYSGVEDLNVSTWPNSMVVKPQKYKGKLELKDQHKTKYTIQFPGFILKNTVIGKINALYTGEMIFKDKVHKLIGLIRFQPDSPGFFDGFYGWIRKSTESRSDFFRGFITQNKELLKNKKRSLFKSKDIISYIEGYWIEEIMFDGTFYWEINNTSTPKLVPEPNPLLSDSRFREDLVEFLKNNIEEAEKQKERLEIIQRGDRKLREEFVKNNSKAK